MGCRRIVVARCWIGASVAIKIARTVVEGGVWVVVASCRVGATQTAGIDANLDHIRTLGRPIALLGRVQIAGRNHRAVGSRKRVNRTVPSVAVGIGHAQCETTFGQTSRNRAGTARGEDLTIQIQGPTNLTVPRAASDSNGDACAVDARSVFNGRFGIVIARHGVRATCARGVVATAHAAIVKLQTRAVVRDGFGAVVAGRGIGAPDVRVAVLDCQVERIAHIQASSRDSLTREVGHLVHPIQDVAANGVGRGLWCQECVGREVCTRRAVHQCNATCHAWACK